MRTEDKVGGPTDPIASFEDCINDIFQNKYSDYT